MKDTNKGELDKNLGENLDKAKTQKVLSFMFGNQEYGINISYITTIIENEYPITRVPGAPDYINGVINLRGDIVPIMELRRKLKLPSIDDTQETKIIVVNFKDITIGIKVEQVNQVIEIHRNSIEIVSGISYEDCSEYFSGLCKVNDRVIILIDIEKVIKK